MWKLEASGTLGSVNKQVDEFKPDADASVTELLQIEDCRKFIKTELKRLAIDVGAEGMELKGEEDTRLLGAEVKAAGNVTTKNRECNVSVKRTAIPK